MVVIEGKERLKLRFTNAWGDSVYLGDDAPYIYLSQKGLDGMSASPMLLKSPFGHGQTSVGNTIDERLITIQCALVCNDETESEYFRRRLLKAFNPMAKGTLTLIGNTFTRAAYDVEVTTAPKFQDDDYTDFQSIVMWQVNLIVPHAFLSDMENTVVEMCKVMPLISFPFSVEINKSWEVGSLNRGSIIYHNDGDAPTPVIIEIFGPVEAPKIINETTGEFIQVHTPIQSNEKMIIETSFANKRVTIKSDTGQDRNAFHYINLNSTFFQLVPGDNAIAFDAEEGNDSARVTLYFKRLWLGL